MTGFNYRSRWNVGEDLAVEYLSAHGYEIIERNATFLGGELDIICKKGGLWRFVEVKYRESTLFGYPEDSMTPKKIKTLLRAIEFYWLKNGIDYAQTRLDFLGILLLPTREYEYRLVEDVN
jgi:putative endonuclease